MQAEPAAVDPRAVPFQTVWHREKEHIKARREMLEPSLEGDPHVLGLAISGGGIRSATLSLGIIQKLAEFNFLKHIDYISTVSGGGYIGSWLYSWIREAQLKIPAGSTEPDPKKGFEKVCADLKPGPLAEAPEITFLRQYSNYLTPRISVFNADTWLVAAIWSRNTLLNLAILIAAFGSIVLAIRGGGGWLAHLGWPGADDEFGGALAACLLALLPMITLIGWNLWRNSTIALASSPPDDRDKEQSESTVRWFCISPLFSALLYSFWLARARNVFVNDGLLQGVRANFLVLSLAFFFLQLCSRVYKCHVAKAQEIYGKPPGFLDRIYALSLYVIAPAAAGFVTAALLRVVAFIFDSKLGSDEQPWFVLTWGPALVLVAFALGVVVHVGLMGSDLPEASREWLGRLRGWLMIFSVFWVAVFGLAVYGPFAIAWLGVKGGESVAALGSGWLIATATGLFAGKSDKTSGKKQNEAQQPRRSKILEVVALIAPYLFVVGFAIAVAFGVHIILVHELNVTPTVSSVHAVENYDLRVKNNNIHLSREERRFDDAGFRWFQDRYWGHLSSTEPWVDDPGKRWFLSGWVPLLGLVLIAGGLLSWRVDINEFSMHNFYKNRLVRCYLGASRQALRKPNPFTGFDDNDDSHLDLFTYETGYYGPYPIVNATLNVSSGGKLQFQERRAQSFVFTPHYTGFSAENVVDEMRLGDSPKPRSLAQYQSKSERLDANESPGSHLTAVAYRPSELAGGRTGVGRAIAISGAAVNPNMGYHTSTAVSFLLTVFNVRLGWWLGNALKPTFRYPSPPFGLIYSFRELFGLANADSSYVNLSDGGHFDNMGIYELVRRRCRYIICCDGEQDKNMTFGGIGNAIRKCRTDFGIEIDLPIYRLLQVDGLSRSHGAVGRIKYGDSEDSWGYLVYLKSSMTGDEPTDILEYRARQTEFPNQTTGDQWFDESQFESYRRLGYHIAEKVFSSVSMGAGGAEARKKFFANLYQGCEKELLSETSPRII